MNGAAEGVQLLLGDDTTAARDGSLLVEHRVNVHQHWRRSGRRAVQLPEPVHRVGELLGVFLVDRVRLLYLVLSFDDMEGPISQCPQVVWSTAGVPLGTLAVETDMIRQVVPCLLESFGAHIPRKVLQQRIDTEQQLVSGGVALLKAG